MASEAYLRQLRKTFEQLPNDIPLLLFADKGRDDVFAQATRQVIRAFRELSPRITLKEYDLAHELARTIPGDELANAAHRARTVRHPLAGGPDGRGGADVSGDR
ncbi:MAG: hypothetical protein MZV70_37810 [Desulfobacterales bacterium]|nr:hypothetical protein [Desulfobacterales bacterium]